MPQNNKRMFILKLAETSMDWRTKFLEFNVNCWTRNVARKGQSKGKTAQSSWTQVVKCNIRDPRQQSVWFKSKGR
jgi:hypothetical protein